MTAKIERERPGVGDARDGTGRIDPPASRVGNTSPAPYRFGVMRPCRTGTHDRCVYRVTCECPCHRPEVR